MTSTPITSTYAPSAFFRPRTSAYPRRLRRRSSSTSASSSSAASGSGGYLSTGESSSEADCSDDDSDSEDDDRSSGDSEFERASSAMSGAWPKGNRSITTLKPSGPGAGGRAAHLKLSLAVLHSRQSLSSSAFSTLAIALGSLASSLPSTASGFDSLGAFVPILARLADDLERELGDKEKGREWRRGLRKEDAKALVGLQQRWAGQTEGKGKGKQKESEQDWAGIVRSLLTANPPPSFLVACTSSASSAFFTSLESLLLPSSLPRLSLAGLGLTTSVLEQLDVFRRAEEALDWYLSFSPPTAGSRTGRQILDGVRSLDLSRNKLTALPSWLPFLLPNLETFSLSNNSFRLLPPSLTSFRELRRLRTKGNELARRGRTKLPRRSAGADEAWPRQEQEGPVRSNTREMARLVRGRLDQWAAAVASSSALLPVEKQDELPSLLQLSLQLARASFADALSKEDTFEAATFANLPPHLSKPLSESYTCCSCLDFITPFSTLGIPASPSSSSNPSTISLHLPPLYDRLHHLSPGVSLPTQILSSRAPSPAARSSSPSPSPNRPSPGLSLLTLEERVLLALYGRGTELTTYVVGSAEGYRHCLRCMIGHLGLLGEEKAVGLGRECACEVCEEERWVKGEKILRRGREGQSTGVMRWLRRRPGRRKRTEGD